MPQFEVTAFTECMPIEQAKQCPMTSGFGHHDLNESLEAGFQHKSKFETIYTFYNFVAGLKFKFLYMQSYEVIIFFWQIRFSITNLLKIYKNSTYDHHFIACTTCPQTRWFRISNFAKWANCDFLICEQNTKHDALGARTHVRDGGWEVESILTWNQYMQHISLRGWSSHTRIRANNVRKSTRKVYPLWVTFCEVCVRGKSISILANFWKRDEIVSNLVKLEKSNNSIKMPNPTKVNSTQIDDYEVERVKKEKIRLPNWITLNDNNFKTLCQFILKRWKKRVRERCSKYGDRCKHGIYVVGKVTNLTVVIFARGNVLKINYGRPFLVGVFCVDSGIGWRIKIKCVFKHTRAIFRYFQKDFILFPYIK